METTHLQRFKQELSTNYRNTNGWIFHYIMNFFIYLGVLVSKSNSALHGVGKSKKHINKVDQVGIRSLSLQWDEKENTPETAKQLLHPGKLTFWTPTMEVWTLIFLFKAGWFLRFHPWIFQGWHHHGDAVVPQHFQFLHLVVEFCQ